MQWVEISDTRMTGQEGRKEKVSVKIPMIGDEDFRQGLQLFTLETLHYNYTLSKANILWNIDINNRWDTLPEGIGSG